MLFDRVAGAFGCTAGQARTAVAVFLVVMTGGIYLAGVAGIQLIEHYRSVEGEEFAEEGDEIILEIRRDLRERGMLPTLLDEGQVVPDAPLRPDGTLLRCGPMLGGQSGLMRGWLWIAEEEGCRRVARQVVTGKGRRLMVVLDWESLNVSPRLIEKVDRRLRCLIEARFGTCWEEVLHRIYIGTSDKETPAWLRRYRSEGKLERWRLPKHRGRRAPDDWDFRIRQNVIDWCVRHPRAGRCNTTMVLVSNEGKFGSVVKELDKRGVELLLVSTSKPSEDLRRVFGDNRSELLEIGAMDGA